ncbi:MAG: class I SAM-dependent methyltransferase [Prosthecobacter sp.]|uniref:class I SAM-dependent methyltransferase n=1 Tax=Prosthecobacter sp. TaxID=1965333 RepID=UPI0026137D7B|nr:class I SAM-dependent methyltransferase [Prosthecobacter sp.]MCF7788447.1 class I SAM-dependent methyltransferase [Prosthecobacter sp.]
MNRLRFFTIAHRDLSFCCPVSSAKFEQVIEILDLPPQARVLDVGCGKAELLLRVMQRYNATGVGADPNAGFIHDAQTEAARRGHDGRVELHGAKIQDIPVGADSFDVALCIGSTHAFGRFAEALTELARLVKPGGQVLIADGYWKQKPDPDYLAFLGAAETDLPDHAGNESAGLEAGLVPFYSCVSSEDEWDHYEGRYCLAIERFLRDHPEDTDASASAPGAMLIAAGGVTRSASAFISSANRIRSPNEEDQHPHTEG